MLTLGKFVLVINTEGCYLPIWNKMCAAMAVLGIGRLILRFFLLLDFLRKAKSRPQDPCRSGLGILLKFWLSMNIVRALFPKFHPNT